MRRLAGSEPQAGRTDRRVTRWMPSASALQGAPGRPHDREPEVVRVPRMQGPSARGERPQVRPASFCSRNGSRLSMRGSSRPGRPTATSHAWGEDPAAGSAATAAWSIFERVVPGRSRQAASPHDAGRDTSSWRRTRGRERTCLFDFAVVDEAQDISVAHLRFFAALGGDGPMLSSSPETWGRRIFQQPFSWKALGVDIRGRSRRCASTTARRTRSACRPTACSVRS